MRSSQCLSCGPAIHHLHCITNVDRLTLVAKGGLVASLNWNYVRSRYLCVNICYAFAEPYQPQYNDWDVCERKGKKILYVNAAALAFCSVCILSSIFSLPMTDLYSTGDNALQLVAG